MAALTDQVKFKIKLAHGITRTGTDTSRMFFTEFLGCEICLAYEYDDSEILWKIIDVDTGHIQLLDKILHEHYQFSAAIGKLINKDIDEKKDTSWK